MKKNNKTDRASKKRRKHNKPRKHSSKIALKKREPSAIEMNVLNNHTAHLSQDERKKLINGVSKNGKEQFDNSLENIKAILRKFDGILLISIISAYCLISVSNDESNNSNKNTNPCGQPHIEISRANILAEHANNTP